MFTETNSFKNSYDRSISTIANEKGVAIIAALLILMLLSFVAITSTRTVMTEKRIVRSDAVFEQNFYLAESAALESIQKVDSETAISELLPARLTGMSKNRNLLIAPSNDDRKDDLAVLDRDGDNDFDSFDIAAIQENSEVNANTYRIMALQGVASGTGSGNTGSGTSLGMGNNKSTLYDYMAYGVTENNNGKAVIKMGYKKRF